MLYKYLIAGVMEDKLLQGFEEYYNMLIHNGFVQNASMDNFIIASWICDVLNGRYGILVDSNDYCLLNSLYQYVSGDCLVPYTNYCNSVTVNKNIDSKYIRYLETNSISRLLEINNDFRMF